MSHPITTVAAALLTICTAVVLLACPADAAQVKPLSAQAQRVLAAIPSDPPPSKLIQQQHYLVSDEVRPERFRTAIRDLGGIFVGVGPEQNYLFAGWAKPEVLVLLDFDQLVVDLHAVYRAFFLNSPNPKAFLALWSAKERARARVIIAKEAKDATQRAAMLTVYQQGRGLVELRLETIRQSFSVQSISCFLTEPAQYRFLVALLRAGRVKTIRGDLTGKQTMKGLAQAAKQLGMVVRGLYLSNVEHYFDYSSGLGPNITALPIDERSMIIRTAVKHNKYDRYYYVAQRAEDFRAWLRRTTIRRMTDMFKRLKRRRRHKLGQAWLLPGPP